jgi:hypothetical protein
VIALTVKNGENAYIRPFGAESGRKVVGRLSAYASGVVPQPSAMIREKIMRVGASAFLTVFQ